MPADPFPIHESYPSLLLRALWTSKSHEHTKREANYIETMLDIDMMLSNGMRLLDVPCGNGRIALELAARGHHVTGIDLAEKAIERAEQDAERDQTQRERPRRGSVTYRVGDMRDLPQDGDFDGAYCLWESFGYFDDTGNLGFLKSLAGALKPGAKLLLDTHVLESLLPHMARREWTELDDDLLVLEQRDYDHITSTMTRRWQVRHGAEIEHSALNIRVYSYRTLVAMLEEAGFTGCTGYTWMSIVPFMTGANRPMMVATRV